ncbi:PREDICTED: uncharacterized protein LOC109466127 [Branchiostoma belcheri]|uniref:Uncharacterized protein LOC109466127 n=1 Tax=Branchiostoma belcheri TaxID=7741 RepID=A0A6P4XRT9_BRABE|nr:PREDICTED: uncharacterized protein LOC109466127 [Branchiostoma belcheri]
MYGVRGAVPTLIVLTWVSYAYCYYVPSRSALQFILERAQEEEEEDTTGYLLSLLRPVPTTQPSVLLDLPFEPETDLSELFKRQDDILSSGDADPEAVSERTPGRRRPYRPPKQKGRNRGKGRARSRNRGRNKNRNPNRNRNRNPNRNRNRNRNNKNGNKQKGGRPSPSAHDRRSRFVLALASLAQRVKTGRSEACHRHFHRIFYETRECKEPALFRKCETLLSRLVESPQCQGSG